MGRIFGYKRWYEVSEIKKIVKRKIKVIRKYLDNEYFISENENNSKKSIKSEEFIKKLINYKIKKIELGNKFNVGNIFFKLKILPISNGESEIKLKEVNEIVKKIEILQQSKKMANYKKNKNKKVITRDILLKKLEELNEKKELVEIIDFGKKEGILSLNELNKAPKSISIDNIDIKLYKNFSKEDFEEIEDDYALNYNILDENSLKSKRIIYIECQNINRAFYTLIKSIKGNDIFKNRYYLKILEEKFLKENNELKNIIESLKKIKNEIGDHEELKNNIIFLFNISEIDEKNKKISENKKQFTDKILRYIESGINVTEEDIIEFLIGELKKYNIIKREEPRAKATESRLVKTYITLDKHVKYKETKETKDKTVGKLIVLLKEEQLTIEIEKILNSFKVDELKDKIEKEICISKKIDTNLFGIFKEHYKTIMRDISKEDFNRMLPEKKELYKIIYRYLKGRVEKILQRRNEIDKKNLLIGSIFEKENLNKKIEIRVKQYCLEHILYLGKIEQLFKGKLIEVNTTEFKNQHAKEELALELITFFATTNVVLNEVLSKKENFEGKEEYLDCFGGEVKQLKVKHDSIATKEKMLRGLNFLDKTTFELTPVFDNFIKGAYSIRNKILHGKFNELVVEKETNLKENYEKISEIIKEFRVKDEDICKSLNIGIIFENKKCEIKKINKLEIKENEESRYIPSFSKLVPEIKKIIQENDSQNLFNDKKLEAIVLNAAIYVNKILYLKEISNSTSKFMKELKITLNKRHFSQDNKINVIEELYKKAQIMASKGKKNSYKKISK